uniref:Uncharacterized protein n=1 Tax=Rhizophora mucronata TaxID=61149 RepID=A0A2P2N782_RHIMU
MIIPYSSNAPAASDYCFHAFH